MSMIEAQGWGPPGTWSGHPEGCDCGCQGPSWRGVQDCWRQVAELRAIVRQVVSEMNIPGAVVSPVAPVNAATGTMWWNGSQMQVWDGARWSVVGAGATVAPTPPTNPTQGMIWWNGTVLQMWDGTKWVDVGGAAVGSVPTATQVLALRQTASISIPAATWTITPVTSTPSIDTQSAWNAATRQFMPKVAGVYLFFIRWVGAAPGGDIGTAILRNDTGSFTGQEPWLGINYLYSAAYAGQWIGTSAISNMNGTTDFVRMFVFNATAWTWGGNSAIPIFEAWLMP
jgi:hypothetical protein